MICLVVYLNGFCVWDGWLDELEDRCQSSAEKDVDA